MGSTTSSMFGAPTHKWTKNERQQMKNIHHVWKQCFPRPLTTWNGGESGGEKMKSATETPEESPATDVLADKKSEDHEEFLSEDSLLRTEGGQHWVPKNQPFVNFKAFKESCKFNYWQEHFNSLSDDPIFSAAARAIVSRICVNQSRKKLHYHHGSIPGGFFLRKKREHIVPLSLFLHELKLWATYELRTLNPFDKSSADMLDRRMKYVEAMENEDIWVFKAKRFKGGMKKKSSHTLFLVLLNIKEQIQRCRDYCLNCHGSKGNIEKLQFLSNALRHLILNESIVGSSIFEAEDRLNSPKTIAFSPLDVLNSAKAQQFIDYRNIGNICLYRLFKEPLLSAALLSKFDSVANVRESISKWHEENHFMHGDSPKLETSGHGEGILPKFYPQTSEEISNFLRNINPEAEVPPSAEGQMKSLKQIFNDNQTKEVMSKFLAFCGAIQQLVPAVVVINMFSEVGKHGGDYTIYESLGEQIKIVIQRAEEAVKKMQKREQELISCFSKCAGSVERSMEENRLKTMKSSKPPVWVENLVTLKHSTLLLTKNTYKHCLNLVHEISEDTESYDMSADKLNDKISYVKSLCDQLASERNNEVDEDKQPEQSEEQGTPKGDKKTTEVKTQ